MKSNSWWPRVSPVAARWGAAPSRAGGLLLFIVLAAACSGQTLYSDFEAGSGFSTNSWCVTTVDATGCGTPLNEYIAASFTPSVSATLSTITLALGLISGPNQVYVALFSNGAGGVPGTPLEFWTPTGLSLYGGIIDPVTVVDTQHVALQAGTTYWVVVEPYFQTTSAAWYTNSLDLAGGLYSVNDGATWASLGSGQTQPAFSVTGTYATPQVTAAVTAAVGGSCPVPAAQTTFLTTDSAVWFDFSYTGGTAGDVFQIQWIEPNGAVENSDSFTQPTTGGTNCYNYYLSIAGFPPASLPGNWTVKLLWNGTQIYAAPFTISASSTPPGGSLGVSTNAVSFSALAGQLPPPQSFSVTSTSGTLSYGINTTYNSDLFDNWINLSQTSGVASPSSPSNVTVSVSSGVLVFPPGKYMATLTVTGGTSPEAVVSPRATSPPTVTVTLTITTLTLVFGALTGASAPTGPQDPQTFPVTATGSTAYIYTILYSPVGGPPQLPSCPSTSITNLLPNPAGPHWLIVGGSNALTGTRSAPENLPVSVQPQGLQPGTYIAELNLVVGSMSTPVNIYLTVTSTPSSAPVSFSYTMGGSLPTAYSTGTFSSGCAPADSMIAVGAASDQGWLAVSSSATPTASATMVENLPGSVTITANPSGLLPGTYYGTVVVTDADGEQDVISCVLTVTAAASTSTSALPHFAAYGPWTTGIFVINTGTQPANFSIAFHDDNGAPNFPFGGAGPLSGTVPALGMEYYETPSNPSGNVISGSGQIKADPTIHVQALFRESASGNYYEAAVPSTPGAMEFEIPFDFTNFAATNQPFYTGFAIANLDPVNTAALTCTALNSGGATIPNPFAGANPPPPPQLNPLGHWANYIFPALTGLRGTITCVSNATIGATALRFIGNNAFSSLPVITSLAASAQTSALPHFAAAGPWTTGIFVLNTGTQSANFSIAFHDDNGAPNFPFGGTSPLSGTVPALGLEYYETPSNPSGNVISGSGQITAGSSIVVQALFRESASGNYYEAAVPSTAGSKEFEIPFDFTSFAATNQPFYTGFAIANLDPVNTAALTCTALNSSGATIPNPFAGANPPPPQQLLPLGHWANYVFPALTGLRGTIDCVSNTTIGATALRFIGNDAFSSLPVILK